MGATPGFGMYAPPVGGPTHFGAGAGAGLGPGMGAGMGAAGFPGGHAAGAAPHPGHEIGVPVKVMMNKVPLEHGDQVIIIPSADGGQTWDHDRAFSLQPNPKQRMKWEGHVALPPNTRIKVAITDRDGGIKLWEDPDDRLTRQM